MSDTELGKKMKEAIILRFLEKGREVTDIYLAETLGVTLTAVKDEMLKDVSNIPQYKITPGCVCGRGAERTLVGYSYLPSLHMLRNHILKQLNQ